MMQSDAWTDRLSGVIAGASSQVLARGCGLAFGLASTIVVSRHLGLVNYGAYLAVLAYWSLFNLASEMGLSSVVSSQIAKPNAPVADIWVAGMICQFGYSLLAAFLGLLLVPVFFSADGDVGTIAAIGVVLLFGSLPAANAAHQIRLRMWIPSALSIFQSMLLLILNVVGANRGAAWPYFLVANAVSAVAMVSISALLGWKSLGRPAGGVMPLASSLLKISLPVGLAGLFATVYYKVDTVLVYHVLGSAAVGVYGAAYRLYEIGLMAPTAVMTAAIPVAIRLLHTANSEHKHYAGRVLEALVLLGLLFAALGSAFSSWAVRLVFGPAFAEATIIFVLLMPGLVARFASIWLGTLLIAAERRRTFFWIACTASLMAVGAYAVIIPAFGLTGTAIVSSLIELLVVGASWVALKSTRPHFSERLYLAIPLGLVGWVAGGVVSFSDNRIPTRILGVLVCGSAAIALSFMLAPALRGIGHESEARLRG